jgi:two-component system OmpR family response regulator
MKSDKTRILLVEDDPNFGVVMRDYLVMNGYEVVLCQDGNKGYTRFINEKFDLCILDVMMPEKDGFVLGKEIRRHDPNVPMVFLTARAMKEDVIKGFTTGADDYVTKPFDPEILLHRLKAVLLRNNRENNTTSEQSEYEIGNYLFNFTHRTLTLGDHEQRLSPREAELLKMLCSHINEVVPREKVLKKIWGDNNYFTGRSMDVFITRIRKYLKDDPAVELLNVHGSGFRIVTAKDK